MIIIRIILIITLGFLIGIIYGLCFEKNIALFFILILLIYYFMKDKSFINKIKNILIIFIISAIVSNVYVLYLKNEYKKIYKEEGAVLKTQAIIVEGPKENEYTYSYVIKVNEGKYKNKKFIAYVKKHDKNIFEYGNLVKLQGEFKAPDSARNYKGFDYSKYLKTKKIYGIIGIEKIDVINKVELNHFFIIVNDLRKNILYKINTLLPNSTQGLLSGILIGQTENLSKEVTESFKNSGLTHVLSVSGMHTSYLIIGIGYILNKNSKKTKQIATIIILIIFMFLTKLSLTVIRATIMSIIMIGSKIFYRKLDILISMCLSLLITLIYNPYSINDIGLQLSYLGTLSIVLFNKPIYNFVFQKLNSNYSKLNDYYKYKKVTFDLAKNTLQLVCVSVSAQILIIPIIALQFNNICLSFWISAIFTSFIIGVIVILGFITIILSFVFIPKILIFILNFLLESLIFISGTISNIPFSNLLIKTPKLIYIYFYYAVVIYIYYCIYKSRKINIKIVVKVILIIIVIVNLTNVTNKIFPNLKIYFIDVGQGDSTLIVTPKNKNIIIDGGESEDTLFSYLLDRRINKIDYLIVSHFDKDHCGGLVQVVEKLNVKNLIISKQSEIPQEYLQIVNIANDRKIKITEVKKGDKINIEKEIYIDILYPSKDLKYNDLNNNSIVARLVYNNFSILFTGDIEESEKELLNYNLKSSILKISHHGSKTSTSQEFLNKVNPEIALIGVGKNNKFGHPSKEVLEKISKLNCKIYRTDKMGEITIKVNKNGKMKIKKFIK